MARTDGQLAMMSQHQFWEKSWVFRAFKTAIIRKAIHSTQKSAQVTKTFTRNVKKADKRSACAIEAYSSVTLNKSLCRLCKLTFAESKHRTGKGKFHDLRDQCQPRSRFSISWFVEIAFGGRQTTSASWITYNLTKNYFYIIMLNELETNLMC